MNIELQQKLSKELKKILLRFQYNIMLMCCNTKTLQCKKQIIIRGVLCLNIFDFTYSSYFLCNSIHEQNQLLSIIKFYN